MENAKLWFENNRIYLQTGDDRTASLPLKGFPRLYNATAKQREKYTLSPMGIHWEELDEDLSFEGFFVPTSPDNEISKLLRSFPEINLSQFARQMGINQSLLAKYITGIKTPSEQRKQQILQGLHRLGKELSAASL